MNKPYNQEIPTKLKSILEDENIGFTTFAKRNQPTKTSFGKLIIAICFLTYSSLNFSTWTIIIFVASLLLLVHTIRLMTSKGGYFVGTTDNLIHYNRDKIKYYVWSRFTGNMDVDIKKNDLSLEYKKDKKNTNDFKLEMVYLSGIDNLDYVRSYCINRIKDKLHLDPIKPVKK